MRVNEKLGLMLFVVEVFFLLFSKVCCKKRIVLFSCTEEVSVVSLRTRY